MISRFANFCDENARYDVIVSPGGANLRDAIRLLCSPGCILLLSFLMAAAACGDDGSAPTSTNSQSQSADQIIGKGKHSDNYRDTSVQSDESENASYSRKEQLEIAKKIYEQRVEEPKAVYLPGDDWKGERGARYRKMLEEIGVALPGSTRNLKILDRSLMTRVIFLRFDVSQDELHGLFGNSSGFPKKGDLKERKVQSIPVLQMRQAFWEVEDNLRVKYGENVDERQNGNVRNIEVALNERDGMVRILFACTIEERQ